jgi:hypothetical protein
MELVIDLGDSVRTVVFSMKVQWNQKILVARSGQGRVGWKEEPQRDFRTGVSHPSRNERAGVPS